MRRVEATKQLIELGITPSEWNSESVVIEESRALKSLLPGLNEAKSKRIRENVADHLRWDAEANIRTELVYREADEQMKRIISGTLG